MRIVTGWILVGLILGNKVFPAFLEESPPEVKDLHERCPWLVYLGFMTPTVILWPLIIPRLNRK